MTKYLTICFLQTGSADSKTAHVEGIVRSASLCRGFARAVSFAWCRVREHDADWQLEQTSAASRDASRKGPGTVATAKTTVVRLENASKDEYWTRIIASTTWQGFAAKRAAAKRSIWISAASSTRNALSKTANYGDIGTRMDYGIIARSLRCIYKDCDKLCLPNCRYCGYHKCTFEGCLNFRDNEKDVERLFCRDHGCEVTRCYAVAIIVKKGAFGTYCRRHTCRTTDCREVCISGEYCEKHSCNWDGCDRIRIGGGTFCEEHECRRSGCGNKARLRLGYCEEHCCKIDKCLNFNDTGSDKLCYEHSRTELHKKIKHLEDRLRGRGYESHHYDDLKCRHDKLARDYDSCLLRLNESREEIRILRSTWISEEDNRIWRKDLEDRNARLLLDLEREQRRVEHWERKAGEVLRRVDELEELLAEERLRFPPTDGYERRISDLVRKVEILEEELRIERENHTLHEGRRYEVEKLLRTIAELERKLADEHIRSARVDELFKKVEILQAMLAGEREQKDILLEDIAKRDEYDRCYRERYERRRWRRGSFERKRPFPERVERVVERERVYGVGC
ncbi:hypothetical protein GCG54_00006974 [Colletotrichum gloeosporioides]|uniref:Uncharacterized protein n=1 Tax=Colletotrichum gloeosporioides TaxID=474922 RepID=A0A8H4CB19_COLGL|nr:uncharacterized protein GCG54_00006974 [Colletotrichum gloeosporioides]KAF3800715.1 hypothetical protein GCG54_00006974 [Colletotrichum gloeosporioides]